MALDFKTLQAILNKDNSMSDDDTLILDTAQLNMEKDELMELIGALVKSGRNIKIIDSNRE